MTTEVIFVELNLYETNLANLVTTYELAHNNYLTSMAQNNAGASQVYLSQMNDLNLEILLLIAEISQNIIKINNDDKYAKYKTEIAAKMADLNTLYSKMQVDEKRIKELMFDLIDLDGKNANFQIQHKYNFYSITLYLFLIGIIVFLILRFSLSSETNDYETVVLILAILLLVYTFWKNISSLSQSSVVKAGSATTTYVKNFLH